MSDPKRCFVISPIGDAGSDTRKHADDFLDLLVEPALTPFQFDIIRADRITSATIITNDIIELVQNSQLCLVDLTFHNPNVFYECGRRHETGRPTIQLIKRGEKLPFDVAGIRTIEYDLSDPRSTLESVKTVQRFISDLDARNAYGEASSGASLSTIAETLRRIERRLSMPGNAFSRSAQPTTLTRKDLITMHPAQAFHKAMEAGDLESAKYVLPRVEEILGERQYLSALAMFAETGDKEVSELLYNRLEGLDQAKDGEGIQVVVVGLTDFHVNTGTTDDGIRRLTDYIYRAANDNSYSDAERAFILNRLQMLRYQAEQFEDALRDAIKVVQLAPDDFSYHFNLSLIYEKLERFDEAADEAIAFVKLCDSPQPHHLEHCSEALQRVSRQDELEAALTEHGITKR